MFEDDDNKTHASDTVGNIADGVKDGDLNRIGQAVKDDAMQTKDDAEDAVMGEDGNNS